MSATPPLFPGLPPASWQQTAALGSTQPAASSAATQNNSDWFAQSSSSARVLSVQAAGVSSNHDVDSWANQLVNHLLEPASR
jgi:hypothetical protein